MKNIFVLAFVILTTISSCKKEDGTTLPTVTTTAPTNITLRGVKTGGNVISDGGATIIERGIVFGTDANPTILTNKLTDAINGLGAYTSVLSSLTSGITYHIRAYAINEVGVSYGADISFKTLGTTPIPSTSFTTTKSLKLPFSPLQFYTLFRFKDSTNVANTDSATSNWDFGFIQSAYAPNMFVNSHSSGPGNAGAIVQANAFNTVVTAPLNGYAYDTTATQTAIKGSDWYSFNLATPTLPTIVTPRTFVFKTADGAHYAKLELTSVSPVNMITGGPFGSQPDSLVYTFRYTYQTNGTNIF